MIEKATLKKYHEQYCRVCNSDDNDVSLDDLERGVFSWREEGQQGEVPIRKKAVICERFMEKRRFGEEIVQIKEAMVNFMSFYKDNVVVSLKSQLSSLQSELHGSFDLSCAADHNTESSVTKEPLYKTNSKKPDVIAGKIALLHKGFDFAMCQLADAVEAFKRSLQEGVDGFRLFLDDHGEEDVQEGVGGDDFCSDQGSSSETEDINDNDDTDDDTDDQTHFSVPDCVKSVLPRNINGILLWSFPSSFSQSTHNGRNGSNACSVISLFLGKFIPRHEVNSVNSSLSTMSLEAIAYSIDFGNRLYDLCRHSLPSRYLSVLEASKMLPSHYNLEISDPLPVRLADPLHLATVCGQLESLQINEECGTALITVNEMTSIFLVEKNDIMYIDTHSHHPHGAVVLKSSICFLEKFCKAVWELGGHNELTFGNMVFVKY